MTTPQVVSLTLLWTAIIAEGVLLFLLYRHVGFLYATQGQGLAEGTQVPPLRALAARSRETSLPELLTANYTLLVFGSPSCSSCQALLSDQGVRQFLADRSMPGYFLTDNAVSDVVAVASAQPALQILEVEGNVFGDYAIPSVPFAYVVTQAGTVIARGPVGGGLRSLMKICESAAQRAKRMTVQMSSTQSIGH